MNTRDEEAVHRAIDRITRAESQAKKGSLEQSPYWSALNWERWAYQLYHDIPESQKYLPKWFLQAVEER